METPASNNTINRSGNDKLYTLEEQDKKRAKEEKKAKKKKDKKDKVTMPNYSITIFTKMRTYHLSHQTYITANQPTFLQKSKKHKTKKKSDEDEIIVAHEEQIESGNDFPTLPVSRKSNDDAAKETPYFMATADPVANHNQLDATVVRNKDDTAITYGQNTIPRANIQQNQLRWTTTTNYDGQNIQQNFAPSTRKEDENHLIYRREEEKDEDTEPTGASDDAEVTKMHSGLFLIFIV